MTGVFLSSPLCASISLLFSSLLHACLLVIPLTALTVRLCTNWTVGDQSATKGDRLSIALRESPVTPIRNGETIRRTRRLLGLGTDAVAVAEALRLGLGHDERTCCEGFEYV